MSIPGPGMQLSGRSLAYHVESMDPSQQCRLLKSTMSSAARAVVPDVRQPMILAHWSRRMSLIPTSAEDSAAWPGTLH